MRKYYEQSLTGKDDLFCPNAGHSDNNNPNFNSASCILKQVYGPCSKTVCKIGEELLKKEGIEKAKPKPRVDKTLEKKNSTQRLYYSKNRAKYKEYNRKGQEVRKQKIREANRVKMESLLTSMSLQEATNILDLNAEAIEKILKGEISMEQGKVVKLNYLLRKMGYAI